MFKINNTIILERCDYILKRTCLKEITVYNFRHIDFEDIRKSDFIVFIDKYPIYKVLKNRYNDINILTKNQRKIVNMAFRKEKFNKLFNDRI